MSEPFIVAIAGGSCSGKSTFAEALAHALQPQPSTLFNMDRYMRHEDGPRIRLSSQEELFNANHPESTDNQRLLEDLNQTKAEVAIVEGLMALHLEALRERAGLKIFIDLDPASRSVRRLVRNQKRQPDQDLEWIGRYYLECAAVGHASFIEPSKSHADLILRGDGNVERNAFLVAKLVENLLAHRNSERTPRKSGLNV